MSTSPAPTPAPAPYRPESDLQGILDVVNEILPTDKPIARALLADRVSKLASSIIVNWPAPTKPDAPAENSIPADGAVPAAPAK